MIPKAMPARQARAATADTTRAAVAAACRPSRRRSVARVAPTTSVANNTAVTTPASSDGPHELEQLSGVDGGEDHTSAVMAGPCETRRPKMAAMSISTQTETTIGPSAPEPKTLLIP